MYFFLNTALGVSTGYGNILKIILPGSKLKWLNSDDYTDVFNWRFYFLAGIIGGGFLSARSAGMPWVTVEMGRFTALLDWSFSSLAVWFLGGGLLLGLGGRLAHGCTSGHSIHGIANLHLSSIIATLFFLLGGIFTVRLITTFVLGGM
jgi:uncharacterized membrane protein YedE/YeeE